MYNGTVYGNCRENTRPPDNLKSFIEADLTYLGGLSPYLSPYIAIP
jgi:hypothetical protein